MMKNKLSLILSFSLFGLGAALPAAAAPALATASGIEGDSTVKGFEKALDVTGYSLSASNAAAAAGSGSGAGKVSFQSLIITRQVDKASPILMRHMALGKVITNFKLSVLSPISGETPFIKIDLGSATIRSYQISSPKNVDGKATEQISVDFGTITFTVTPSRGAPASFGFDVRSNEEK